MSLSSAAIAAQAAALALPALPSPGGGSRSLVVVAGGGRDLAWPPARIASQLLARTGGRAVHLLLHGGARGADQAISRAADQLGWYALSLPAEWHLYGRGAGPIRNRQLLEQALAVAQARCTATSAVSVLVVAFPACCSPRTTEPSDPAEPWGLAITPPGLPRLPHHARAEASRSTAFRDPCAALASPGRSGGVVRHPCHGSPSLPRSAKPRADRAPVPDPCGFTPSARYSRPAAAGALPRSRGPHRGAWVDTAVAQEQSVANTF